MTLPNSLRRRAAATAGERESAVLDNFKLVREIQAGVFTPNREPDLSDHTAAIESAGMRWEFAYEDRPTPLVIYSGDKRVAFLVDLDGEFVYAPVE